MGTVKRQRQRDSETERGRLHHAIKQLYAIACVDADPAAVDFHPLLPRPRALDVGGPHHLALVDVTLDAHTESERERQRETERQDSGREAEAQTSRRRVQLHALAHRCLAQNTEPHVHGRPPTVPCVPVVLSLSLRVCVAAPCVVLCRSVCACWCRAWFSVASSVCVGVARGSLGVAPPCVRVAAVRAWFAGALPLRPSPARHSRFAAGRFLPGTKKHTLCDFRGREGILVHETTSREVVRF